MKQRLTILHTESHRAWGGQERRVLTECLWMRERGHRVVLAAPRVAQIYDRAGNAGIEVHAAPFNVASAFGDYRRIRRLLKALSPDVLNTHGNMDAKIVLIAARGMGIPCVIRSRHHSHPVSPKWHNRFMYRHLSDYVFTTAQCTSDQLARDLGVDPAKLVTLASGIVPPERLPEQADARAALQLRFALEPTARFIGCVAMLRDWKGHHVLIDAFSRLVDRHPYHHLVLVGDGDGMEPLKSLAREKGLDERVHFTGFEDDPWPFFRAFDVNVLASLKNEGIPQALLQAMAARCPVIGSRTGGIPDIVTDGDTGLLVVPDDADALAEAIRAIIEQPEQAMDRAEHAHDFVMAKHTLDAMGKKTLELYEKAFARNRSRTNGVSPTTSRI